MKDSKSIQENDEDEDYHERYMIHIYIIAIAILAVVFIFSEGAREDWELIVLLFIIEPAIKVIKKIANTKHS